MGKLCRGIQRAQRLQRVQRLQRAPRAHVEALAQLRPYTAVGLLRQVIPRACGRLAEAVLGRGAQHKHRHARYLGPGAERVQSASRAHAERRDTRHADHQHGQFFSLVVKYASRNAFQSIFKKPKAILHYALSSKASIFRVATTLLITLVLYVANWRVV